MLLLGVDTGGTFTDFVLSESGRVRTHKVLSTPAAPERAILQGIRELGIATRNLRLVHGSTVATNAVLEGKGVRTAYVTNRGFGDVLAIGRQARRRLYDLQPPPVPPPVPPELCLETGGRIGPDGTVIEPLEEADLEALLARLAELRPRAVAVNLLFSWVDDAHERRIAEALHGELFVCRSSEVLRETREYERGIATWINAWVGPLVEGYLERLREAVAPAPVAVMESTGGTAGARAAGRRAVHLLLSGPAGGLTGARHMAAAGGLHRLLSFDMGGTSTDVALIDGDIGLTTEGRVAGYPVALPMADIHTIGAGGGSMARLDAGGLLQVGPESAGAAPGPACYGAGGSVPTVTDAHVVLGRLPDAVRLGGRLPLDREAARRAFAPLAAGLSRTVEEAAAGVLQVVNEHMVRALRVMSVERGVDLAGITLVSFGGAGGLHVCELAEGMGLERALVPAHGGVLSALGMLVAPPLREGSGAVLRPLDEMDEAALEARFQALESRLAADLAADGVPAAAIVRERDADLRYLGQSSVLRVPWRGRAAAAGAFARAHRRRFGHVLEEPVELVNIRVRVRGPEPELELPGPPAGRSGPAARAALWGEEEPVPVYRRGALGAGQEVPGPALVIEDSATTWIAREWLALVDAAGNLQLRRT